MTWLDLGLTFAGPVTLGTAVLLGGLAATRLQGLARASAIAVALALTPLGVYGVGVRYRAPPPPTLRTLAPGLEYERLVMDGPAVVHIVRIDLARPDLTVVATAPAPGKEVPARRVRDFAEETGAEVAINTAFFHPFHAKSPFDYYPKSGDPTEPFGFTMTDGEEFGANRFHHGTIYFTADRAAIEPLPDARWAVTGRTVLVRQGRAQPTKRNALAPRSAIGFDGERLLFVAVDGRQPSYSVGMSLADLARLLEDLGCVWAVEMDGGGSTTLVDGTGETPRTLNCPIHTRLPCRERPVAAQVGIARVRP